MATTYTYPFDPTGSATTNAVANERHVLSPPAWSDFYFIVPKYAPYFRDSLRAIHRPSGKLLVEGKDYHCTHYFHAASHGVARRVYGSITMLDKTLTGVIEISYQTIGGDWILDASADLSRLTNTQINPRITTWEQVIDVPYQFPPIDHEWDLENLKGVEAILPILEGMTTAIRESAGSDFQAHIADKSNPHNVTKDQVGLDQVQNFPLANIAEAQEGALNTRYMTPVRTKNFVDSYLIPLLDAHKSDLSNPHSTTKAQVGLGNVQNYGLATELEARAGVVANKYMTPLQTKQAIETLATTGLTAHMDDHSNPHQTTKAQVGLSSVENFPIASIVEAESAARNDRYMTPLTTAKQIQVLVKDSLDFHLNATNNPHMVNKAQVGLGSVLNFGLATELEARAGAKNDVYMTPYLTRKAIEEIATGSLSTHVTDDQNPHATTKAQVGLGSVQNFPIANLEEAILGESNIRYMTPMLVTSAIQDQVGVDLREHIARIDNPHGTTAAQVGAPTLAAFNNGMDSKLDKLAQASDSAKLESKTLLEVLAAAKAQTAANSDKLEGLTLAEIKADLNSDGVDNAQRLENKTLAEVEAQIIGNTPYTKQIRVPDYTYSIPPDGYAWVPLLTAEPEIGQDHEDVVVLINGLLEVDDLGITVMARINFTANVASAIVLSGNNTVSNLWWTHVGGVVTLWLKTQDEHSGTNVTILSGKRFTTLNPQAAPVTVEPVGIAQVPMWAYALTSENEAVDNFLADSITTLTDSFTTANTNLLVFS